ncbi:MAG: SIMPL domain-containing protein [Rhodobacteraceae bacterium]|jgi:hypothetical protein|nr:SIMPL domain-containing protein [Paracoccaceae bacterium]
MRRFALAVPVLAAFALPAALPAAAADEARATITVSGEGRVTAAPDLATLSVGVTTEAPTAREALDANSAALAAALARLKAAGIEDRDIQTQGLSLGPRYDYDQSGGAPRIAAYTASNMLNVRIRALDTLGAVLDAVVTDGANTLGGITFGLNEPDPLLDEARKAAVADARRKAELYAAAAGVSLGPVISISEQTGFYPPSPAPMASASLAKADAVPIAGGELALSANVTIVYAIGD